MRSVMLLVMSVAAAACANEPPSTSPVVEAPTATTVVVAPPPSALADAAAPSVVAATDALDAGAPQGDPTATEDDTHGSGGGTGEGIGLGNIGTIGHGANYDALWGNDDGGVSRPTLRQVSMSASGPLAPEMVARIIRQNYGRFRLCYENGLRDDPKLAGNVDLVVSIDAQGNVTSAKAGKATLADKKVVGCISRGMGNLSFPTASGKTTVKYTLGLAPN